MELIKKMRRFFIVAYSNRIYNRNVKKADTLCKKYHARFYVVISPIGKSLKVISRKGFRHIKRNLYKSKYKESIISLKCGAFYYTADASGTNGLGEIEKEARRLAFIKYVIHRSDE
ncbi:MAG: hypothetical protein RR313_01775 [Anaerovoracaceae bacterium]